MKDMNDIKPLLEKYLEIVDSEQNQNNKKYWENADEPFLAERWRGRSAVKTNTPFTMAMDISGYSKVMDINCIDYYSKPEEQLYYQLKYAIWEFENLKCQRAFDKTVFISFGAAFMASTFGAKIDLLPGQAPWFDETEHILHDKADLLKVKPLDFYKSGFCEKAYELFEALTKMTEGYDIQVMYPVSLRSPFSLALMLRGFSEVLIDSIEDPGFFNDLMRVITDRLKEYAQMRADFLGTPVEKFKLFNDEISTPMVSKRIYDELIYPYEKELAEFSGGVSYWHSCGKTEEFYESVASLPGLQMVHIGPWSDVAKAAEVFSKTNISLEICLNSVDDIYEKEEDQMREKLLKIKNACDGKVKYQVRADGFAIYNSIEYTMQKINLWNKVALEIFPG